MTLLTTADPSRPFIAAHSNAASILSSPRVCPLCSVCREQVGEGGVRNMYSTAHRTRRHSRCRRRHRRRRHRPTNRRARFLARSPCPGGRSLRPSFLASLFLFPLLSFRLYLAGEAAPLPDSFPLPPSLYPGLHAQCQAHGHRIPPVRPRVPRARGVASLALRPSRSRRRSMLGVGRSVVVGFSLSCP